MSYGSFQVIKEEALRQFARFSAQRLRAGGYSWGSFIGMGEVAKAQRLGLLCDARLTGTGVANEEKIVQSRDFRCAVRRTMFAEVRFPALVFPCCN